MGQSRATFTIEKPVLRTRRYRRWPQLLVLLLGGGLLSLALAYAGISLAAAVVLTRKHATPVAVDPATIGANYSDVAFTSRGDRLPLKGWLFQAGRHDRSVLMVSGRGQNRIDAGFGTAAIATELVRRGYDVLLFDVRTTGASGGDRMTFGVKETQDLLGAYDYLRGQGYNPAAMTIIGDSQGGTMVLQAAPQLTEAAALVTDSAWATLAGDLNLQLPKVSHLPRFFVPGIMAAAHLLYGVNPAMRPIDAVRRLPGRAFLFFQGAADTTVPAVDGSELRAASQNAESRLVSVPGAGHTGSYLHDPAAYLSQLLAFMDSQISERGGDAGR